MEIRHFGLVSINNLYKQKEVIHIKKIKVVRLPDNTYEASTPGFVIKGRGRTISGAIRDLEKWVRFSGTTRWESNPVVECV